MPISDRYIAGRAFCGAFLFAAAAFLAILLLAAPRASAADGSPLLTPEEVAGVSMGDIDALSEMSSEYAVSPDGTPLPAAEGDDWVPDLSLNSRTATESVRSEVLAKTAASVPSPIQAVKRIGPKSLARGASR